MRYNIMHYVLKVKQLLCLEEAVRYGSISKAADKNGMKQPNFSNQIKSLEQEVHQKLVIRHSKGISPTDVGYDYYALACDIKNILDKSEEIPSSDMKMSGLIKLWTTDGLAAVYLSKCFQKFYVKYPNINFEINFSSQMPKLDEFDLALLFYKPKVKTLQIIDKHSLKFSLFASKEYLAKHGFVQGVDDLCLNHKLCYHESHPLKWREWGNVSKNAKHIVSVTNSTFMLLNLVKGGVGIGLLPMSIAMQEDDLVEIKNVISVLETDFYFVAKRDEQKNPKIEALINLINGETAKL